MSDRFKDQVAIVTGGADGVGKAVARRLLAEGARIEIFDRWPRAHQHASPGQRPIAELRRDRTQNLLRLCHAAEANIALGQISILTPVGAGLYGLMAGQSIDWPDLEGRDRRIRILAVKQPARPN